jgi:hypothetical protein
MISPFNANVMRTFLTVVGTPLVDVDGDGNAETTFRESLSPLRASAGVQAAESGFLFERSSKSLR